MKTFFVISNSKNLTYISSTSVGITSFTEGATLVITSASREVKLRKSVRYAIRSSSECLMRTGSTSWVKMAGQVFRVDVDRNGVLDESVLAVDWVTSDELSSEPRRGSAL